MTGAVDGLNFFFSIFKSGGFGMVRNTLALAFGVSQGWEVSVDQGRWMEKRENLQWEDSVSEVVSAPTWPVAS